jgi:hypothetical protein
VTIVKPIVFGNVARYFGKKREEDGHTHQWSIYVKPYRNEVFILLNMLKNNANKIMSNKMQEIN